MKPLGRWILVDVEKVEDFTQREESKLFIAKTSDPDAVLPSTGLVLAIGPGVSATEGLSVGKRVVFPAYAAQPLPSKVGVDDQSRALVLCDEIMGVA